MQARFGLAWLACLAAGPVWAAPPVAVAVASNFAHSAQQIAARFTEAGGSPVTFSAGSSGKLYAQIEHGAPFDVFLSADAERPAQLEREGLAVAGSRFTYAVGRLVLWSGDAGLDGQDCLAALKAGRFRYLSIANPKTAPYGAAAVATLDRLGWPLSRLEGRLVQGENIAQALQYVATGSAQLGFVALAQLRGADVPASSCQWIVPADLHAPILQQAVLLRRGQANAAAGAFLRFLRSEVAGAIVRDHGYDPGD